MRHFLASQGEEELVEGPCLTLGTSDELGAEAHRALVRHSRSRGLASSSGLDSRWSIALGSTEFIGWPAESC